MHDNPPPSQQPHAMGGNSGMGASHNIPGTPVHGQGNENVMAAGNSTMPAADDLKHSNGVGVGQPDPPSQTQRVDGKEFFKQVRYTPPSCLYSVCNGHICILCATLDVLLLTYAVYPWHAGLVCIPLKVVPWQTGMRKLLRVFFILAVCGLQGRYDGCL